MQVYTYKIPMETIKITQPITNPTVTVILPTYNRSSFLKETIQSVLNQSHENLELIVVDDGSTDNSKEIVELIVDKRVKYFYKKNGGVSSARNFGIDLAEGDFISFVDSDDLLDSNKLEAQLKAFASDDTIDAVYCLTDVCDYVSGESLLNRESSKFSETLPEGSILIDLLSGRARPVFYVIPMLFKRKVFDKLRFNETLKVFEDKDFVLRLCKDFKLFGLKDFLYIYRKHDGSSITESHSVIDEEKYNIKIINDFINDSRGVLKPALVRGYLAREYKRYGKKHVREGGSLMRARLMFFKSFLQKPSSLYMLLYSIFPSLTKQKRR